MLSDVSIAPGSWMVDESLVDPSQPQSGFEQQYGLSFYEYLHANPEAWKLFNLKMEHGLIEMLPPVAIRELPLPELGTVLDVGGGLGYVLDQIQSIRPAVEAVLCDQAFVVNQAEETGRQFTQMWSGDIFEDALPSADVYLLTRILHNWSDEKNMQLLSNIRDVARSGARLLIIDTFLHEDKLGPARALQQQRSMDLLLKTQQHTVSELMTLLDAAGWRAVSKTALTPDMDCLEAV